MLRLWGDEEEGLLALEDVVVHTAATEIDVEVGVAVCNRHQAVELDTWELALVNLFLWPYLILKVDIANHFWPTKQASKCRLGYLETDDVANMLIIRLFLVVVCPPAKIPFAARILRLDINDIEWIVCSHHVGHLPDSQTFRHDHVELVLAIVRDSVIFQVFGVDHLKILKILKMFVRNVVRSSAVPVDGSSCLCLLTQIPGPRIPRCWDADWLDESSTSLEEFSSDQLWSHAREHLRVERESSVFDRLDVMVFVTVFAGLENAAL